VDQLVFQDRILFGVSLQAFAKKRLPAKNSLTGRHDDHACLYVMEPLCSWCWGFAPVMDAIQATHPDLAFYVARAGCGPGHPALNPWIDGRRSRAPWPGHWEAVRDRVLAAFFEPQRSPRVVSIRRPPCRAA